MSRFVYFQKTAFSVVQAEVGGETVLEKSRNELQAIRGLRSSSFQQNYETLFMLVALLNPNFFFQTSRNILKRFFNNAFKNIEAKPNNHNRIRILV